MSTKTETGCSGCIARLIALAFVTFGLGLGYFMTFQPLWGMVQAQNWVSTPCRIVSSELRQRGETHELVVVYSYTYANHEYVSQKYCFMQMSSNTSNGWKRRVVAANPAGKMTQCYVNPDNPTESVIERGWVPDMWWGLLPLPVVAVGIGILLASTGLFGTSRSARATTNWQPQPVDSPSAIDQEFGDTSGDSEFQTTGPVTLKPDVTPMQMLTGAIIFSVIWNGIVSIFVWQQANQFWRRGIGGADWFTLVFLTPFVLVGVGLVLFVLYSVLALFNPRPTLTVSSAAIPLGEELKINWSLSGRAGSIRQFRISLKGTEKATYRRGTSTSTDSNTFADIPVIETSDMFEMEEGTTRVTIPGDSMHSFDAPNNKIIWALEVHGEVPLWPDVSASFPITVLPLRSDQQ